MKRIMQLIAAILIGGLVLVYLLIPGKIEVETGLAINCTSAAGIRYFLDHHQWKKWWPDESAAVNRIGSDVGFFYQRVHHRPTIAKFNGFKMQSIMDGNTYDGEMVFAQIGLDSMALFWKYERESSFNPLTRIMDYYQMKQLKENTAGILFAFKAFLENQEKVYGMKIHHQMVTDTLLISTKNIYAGYPNDEQVYSMIGALEKYIQENKAVQTGFPMMNVTVLDSNHFQTMVAIPVDRVLPQTNQFSWKKMVPGKILMSEVKGGHSVIQHSMKEMKMYVSDYHLTSPAIPFVSLVTDRRVEKDSLQWISRIYYPVM